MEVNMSSSGASSDTSTEIPEVGTVDMKLEVVTLPVSDVDRAKRFYQSLGWRLDADFAAGADARLVQMTPPHSQCSIHFGKGVPGVTAMEPGSLQRLFLAVKDIDAARDDLISRGVDVSEVEEQPKPPGSPTCPGARTSRTRRSATRMATAGCSRRSRPGSRAGNGRTDMDVASLADLLHETAEHHDAYEKVAPPHDWWDWYAAYMDARQSGRTPDEASDAAGRYMAEVKHVVV
jgi:catechol 2,3-dioxygenase-like lactoylglutathione lyase family enzyme